MIGTVRRSGAVYFVTLIMAWKMLGFSGEVILPGVGHEREIALAVAESLGISGLPSAEDHRQRVERTVPLKSGVWNEFDPGCRFKFRAHHLQGIGEVVKALIILPVESELQSTPERISLTFEMSGQPLVDEQLLPADVTGSMLTLDVTDPVSSLARLMPGDNPKGKIVIKLHGGDEELTTSCLAYRSPYLQIIAEELPARIEKRDVGAQLSSCSGCCVVRYNFTRQAFSSYTGVALTSPPNMVVNLCHGLCRSPASRGVESRSIYGKMKELAGLSTSCCVPADYETVEVNYLDPMGVPRIDMLTGLSARSCHCR